jgi:hypothetical protein
MSRDACEAGAAHHEKRTDAYANGCFTQLGLGIAVRNCGSHVSIDKYTINLLGPQSGRLTRRTAAP